MTSSFQALFMEMVSVKLGNEVIHDPLISEIPFPMREIWKLINKYLKNTSTIVSCDLYQYKPHVMII